MAQEYIISNAFPAKDKAGNEKTWESQYGTFKVWNIYFEGDDTKYQTNKKVDFQGYAKGETVYGTTGTDRFGNGTFKSEQRPFNEGGQQQRPQQSQPQSNGGVEQRIKKLEEDVAYLKSLLENSPNFKSSESTSQGADEAGTASDDAGLSAIPY